MKYQWGVSRGLQKEWHKYHNDFKRETNDILGYEYIESIGTHKTLILNEKASKAIESFVKYLNWTNYPPIDKTILIMEYMPFANEKEKIDLVKILLKPDKKLYLFGKIIQFFPSKVRFFISRKYYKNFHN